MSATGYPTGTDLADYLTAAGFTVAVDMRDTLDAAAASGIAMFERLTGRKFIGDTTAAVYYFDPPADTQGLLSLAPVRDMYSVTSIAYYPTGGTSTALTLNTDYWLEPANNLAMGRPYEWIRFRSGRWLAPIAPSQRRSIQVTGKAGYGTTIPDDAWEAMMSQAIIARLPLLQQKLTQGVTSWGGAGVTQSFGTTPLGAFASQLAGPLKQTIQSFTRITF